MTRSASSQLAVKSDHRDVDVDKVRSLWDVDKVRSLSTAVYFNDVAWDLRKLVDESLTIDFVQYSASVVVPTAHDTTSRSEQIIYHQIQQTY